MESSRRTFLAGLVAIAGVAAARLRSLRAQTPDASDTPAAATFALVATVESDEWASLADGPATPTTGEELAGSGLLEALRGGGFVIYFRHARTDFSQDDSDLSDLSNCATQRNLSDEGREQARQIGKAIAALKIPIGEVRSSELCRTRQTAELAFGRVTPEPDLTSFGTAESDAEEQRRVDALRQLLSTPPDPGKNTVLVGHQFNIGRATNLNLAEGEAAIFRPLRTTNPAATPTPD